MDGVIDDFLINEILSNLELTNALLADIKSYQMEISMSLHCIEIVLLLYFFHYVISRIGKILRDI